MNVFNKDTQTPQAVTVPASDRTLPGPGSLVWNAIGGVNAFQGVNGWSANQVGADAKLIRGDRWEDVTGTQTSTIGVNHKLHVRTKEQIRIEGSQAFTVVGGATWDFLSTCVETHYGTTNITYMATLTTVHHEPEENTRPKHFETEDLSVTWTWFDFAFNFLALEGTVFSIGLLGIGLDIKGIDMAVVGVKMEKIGVEAKWQEVKAELVALKAMIGTKLKAAPTANAAPTASPTL